MQEAALNTQDQNDVEQKAFALLASTDVQNAKAACRDRLLADPVALTQDGASTLDQALDDLSFAAALGGANGDPSRPRVTWTLAGPRNSFGRQIPGSRYLIDNPDTVYRFTPVDWRFRYQISVAAVRPGPAQFSFMLHDTMFSEGTKKSLANLDQPIAGLRDIDIKAGADGAFTVTVDRDPAAGRPNHIQMDEDARIIWIRNSLNDWGLQNPHTVSIKCLDEPDSPVMTAADMSAHAAAILLGGTDWLLALMNRTFGHVDAPNAVSEPFGRGGAWGFAARGTFSLGPDEALVIVLAKPLAHSYVGFQLTTPWQLSVDYIESTGSLNNRQAASGPDGSFTYVIAREDPALPNWLSTSGLSHGGFLVRWQAIEECAVGDAIRSCTLMTLDAARQAASSGSDALSADQRTYLCAKRAESYAHRYAGSAMPISRES